MTERATDQKTMTYGELLADREAWKRKAERWRKDREVYRREVKRLNAKLRVQKLEMRDIARHGVEAMALYRESRARNTIPAPVLHQTLEDGKRDLGPEPPSFGNGKAAE